MKLILPLGYHCNITFICKGLNIKKETGLFEYLECRTLDDINNIIQILINMKNNGDNNYSKLLRYNIYSIENKQRINIISDNVFTFHYKPNEYIDIFSRRIERFFNRITENNELIFSRINILNTSTSIESIKKFYKLIKQINPNIKITFLLIDTIYNQKLFKPYNIKLENFIFSHRYFLYSDYDGDVYFKTNEKIWNIFYNYITDLGFIKDEIIDSTQFTDKDI
jgi:hypothetical protein